MGLKLEIMTFLSKNWPGILIIVAGFGTFFSGIKDGEQRDNMEEQGKQTAELAKEIKNLTSINNEITQSSRDLIAANKQTADENLALSESSKRLIDEVKLLTEETRNLSFKVNQRTTKTEEENRKTGSFSFDFEANVNDDVYFKIGGMNMGNSVERWQKGAVIFAAGKFVPIKVEFINKRIVLSMNVYDMKGNLIATIERNNWRKNDNFSAMFNYDSRGFEVIDNEGNVVVNINLKSNNTFEISGVFPYLEGRIIIIAGKEDMVNVPFKNEAFDERLKAEGKLSFDQLIKLRIKEMNIQRLFEYTGADYLGKRSK